MIRGGSQSWKKYVILVQKRRPSWIWSLLAKKCPIFQTSTRLILYPGVLSFLLIPNSTMANFNYRKLFTFCFFKSWKIAILIQNIAFLLHFEVNRSKMSIVVYNQNSPCTNLVSKESFRLQDKGLFGWTSEILGTFLPEGLKSKMAAIFGPKSSIFPNFVSPPWSK